MTSPIKKRTCIRCGKEFDKNTNVIYNCLFHPEKLKFVKEKGIFLYGCCMRNNMGCTKGIHFSNENKQHGIHIVNLVKYGNMEIQKTSMNKLPSYVNISENELDSNIHLTFKETKKKIPVSEILDSYITRKKKKKRDLVLSFEDKNSCYSSNLFPEPNDYENLCSTKFVLISTDERYIITF